MGVGSVFIDAIGASCDTLVVDAVLFVCEEMSGLDLGILETVDSAYD